MSILIEGMEMPTEDEEIIIRIDSNGTVMTEYALPISGTKAVSVPPHGRLGDLDKLNEEVRLLINENILSRDDARDLLETIADAPTVIPASGTEVE